MWIKFLYFLSLFAYLNIIVYEAGSPSVDGTNNIFDGDSMIEFILDDVLDVPFDSSTKDIDIPFDDYRIFNTGFHLIPVEFISLAFFLITTLIVLLKVVHPVYTEKSICLPGYYSFLFRYKPF